MRALIEVLAREAGIVEANIDQLYENWFIETCEEWVVPYIGDLLGVRGVHEINGSTVYSRRAYVADTLHYRRRKGTAPILEQLAYSITGWRAKAVEFFQLLSTSQNLNHLRLHNAATPDLRDMDQLDRLNTAFDTSSHTVEVRRIAPGLGRYNLPNLGIYVWRLQSYPLLKADARAAGATTGIPEGAYTFNVLGLDSPLFNLPQTDKDNLQPQNEDSHQTKEVNLPVRLRRRGLHDELEALRTSMVNNRPHTPLFFTNRTPAFRIYLNRSDEPIPFEEIAICNLSRWSPPPASKTYLRITADGTAIPVEKAITAAVDPELGRIVFTDPDAVEQVMVSYNYGFSADLGGGSYDREQSLQDLRQQPPEWQAGVSKEKTAVAGEAIYASLQDAIQAWNHQAAKTGLITLMDSRTYIEDITGPNKIIISEGKQLYIIAADWPPISKPNGASEQQERPRGRFNAEDVRPHLAGDIEVQGTAPGHSSNGGTLVINGLLIEGSLHIQPGNLNYCRINHCTLVHDSGDLRAGSQDNILNLTLQRSICGPIRIASEEARIALIDCLINDQDGTAVEATESNLEIRQCTIWGMVHARSLYAENSIFNDKVDIMRRQTGCVRFSYLPIVSRTPRRFRCQPELEIQMRKKAEEQSATTVPANEENLIGNGVNTWLFPSYNATYFGHPAYGQLSNATPAQIMEGADDGAEMGVYHHLQQPQRLANLYVALEEYLRLGLEGGIIFVN